MRFFLSSWHLLNAGLNVPHPELVEGRMASCNCSPESRHARRQQLLLAQHLAAIEVGDRRPAQLANVLRHLERARLELERVEIFGCEGALALAVLDIGGVML